ncbi:hypothetical protein OIV83_006381 [Microbotryomycetes sp. JL201]|nr:hypothetical protein OIV83_006381 [Microbotryomycetes sp. JL201]
MSSRAKDAKVITLASGKRLFVDIQDGPTPDSPAVFFMHGLGSSTSFYEAPLLSSRLSSKYKIVRYDFDGHGLSPLNQTGQLSIESLVQDLAHVMDYAQVDKAAGVVGHSMSGCVALTFSAKYPERVDKLFLIGPMKAMAEAGRQSMRDRASKVDSRGLSSIVSAVVAAATSQHTKDTCPLALAMIRALVLSTEPEGYSAACRALATATDPDFRKIKATTLILAGAEDYLSNQDTVNALTDSEQGVAGARSVRLDKVGHWHSVEAPAAVGQLLDEFFQV